MLKLQRKENPRRRSSALFVVINLPGNITESALARVVRASSKEQFAIVRLTHVVRKETVRLIAILGADVLPADFRSVSIQE